MFTVAGLVGVAVIVLVITSFLRRRRAKKFDKDTAQAAMEAAASSHRNFDDYGYPGSDISGTGYGGFSAETHGTYGQPAMSHGRDAYMMHDVNGGGGGYGAGDEYAGVAGAAGIGAAVGAVAMQRARSRRSAGVHSQEDYNGYDQTPYPAFAGPGAHLQQQVYDQPQSRSMAESTALGGAVGPFVNRRPSQPHPQAVDLARNKSQGSSGGGYLGNPPQDQRSYASHYQTVGYSDGRGEGPEDPFRRNTLLPPPVSALHNPHDAAYDGYDDLHQHVQGSDDEGPSAEERMSIREDDDYEQPRVLKVSPPFNFRIILIHLTFLSRSRMEIRINIRPSLTMDLFHLRPLVSVYFIFIIVLRFLAQSLQ